MGSIKVTNHGIDIIEVDGVQRLVLRGIIDNDSLRELRVGEYQRDVLPLSTISELSKAFERGAVPDIDLGMRGDKGMERNGAYYLQDPVYIIDGLQRVSAALHRLQLDPGATTRLGATIYFDTTEPWERERFRILNVDRVKLSSNILLRNSAHDFKAIKVLLDLSHSKSFVLYDRVCWAQRMTKGQLVSAVTFTKVAGALHSHAGPGRSSRIGDLTRGVEKIQVNVGARVFRDNVEGFFDLIDECWGVKRVVFKEGALHMRHTFLLALCDILSSHTDFWKGDKLFVPAPLKRKLASFPLKDPSVAQLIGSSGKAREVLAYMLVKHINSGRRTGHLSPRELTEFSLPEGFEDLIEEDDTSAA